MTLGRGRRKRLGRAVRGRREAGDAVEDAELAVVRLGGDGHGGGRLAGPDDDEPAVLGR